MNIVVNAVLSFEQPRGVGRYINNLFPALAEIDKENQYFIYYGKWMKNYEFLRIKQQNFHFIELDIKNTMLYRNYYLAFVLPLKCKKYNPDIFFLVDTQALAIKPCKVLSTIHDLAEFVIPEKYSKKQAFIRRAIVKHQVHISDQIITVSEYSKKDICSRFHISNDRVTVIYNSVETPNTHVLQIPQKYFLYVSEIEHAKNLVTLIKAYALLSKEIQSEYMLYVVGKKGNDYENILNLIESNKIEDRVKFFGFVSDDELNELYAKAYCFVFPSLFEGFGLPVLEAMAKGTPVICSNSSSLPEVGGDAVLTFNSISDVELKDCIESLLNTQGLRNELISKGVNRAHIFSKSYAAQRTLNVFNGIS